MKAELVLRLRIELLKEVVWRLPINFGVTNTRYCDS
jgi:hypothetical protein